MRQAKQVRTDVAMLLLGIVVVAGCSESRHTPPPSAFNGDSISASRTVVVASLDTPVPSGKNVIWCGTVKLAYEALKPLPIPITDPAALEALRRLDNARLTMADLPAGSYYVSAGWMGEGIVKNIQADMAERFPQARPTLPSDLPPDWKLAYAYLASQVKFRNPYFDREGGDEFVDSAGNKTRVSSFGLYKQPDAPTNKTLADQIDILFVNGGEGLGTRDFALDLDNNSQPSQLILACVQPKETLAATWQDVLAKIKQSKTKEFTQYDNLAVPNVVFNLRHQFKEFEAEGKMRVFQAIDFRLDKSGSSLVSEAHVAAAAAGYMYSFTRPFLIAMRKRGSAEPYFVMWVDNAELFCKQAAR